MERFTFPRTRAATGCQPWFRVTYRSEQSHTPADGTRLAAAAGGVLGASGAPIFASADGGMTWALTTAPSNLWQSITSSADGTKLAAVGSSSAPTPAIFVSTNSAAQTWTQTTAPITNWASIASSADGTKLAAAVQGGNAIDSGGHLISWPGSIYTSTNSGATWKATSAPSAAWFAIASSADGTRLAAAVADSNGHIYTSTNSGLTWRQTSAPASEWTAIASSADGRRLLAGADTSPAPLYVSEDSGATWLPIPVSGASYWIAVASCADGNVLAAATFNTGLYVSRSIPNPTLGLAWAGGHPTLSWTVPSGNFALQSTSELGTAWSDVGDSGVLNLTTLKYEVALPVTNPNAFYRLENR